MLAGGSRISHHLRECNHHGRHRRQLHHHHSKPTLGLRLGFCSSKIVQLSSFMLKPPSLSIMRQNHNNHNRNRLQESKFPFSRLGSADDFCLCKLQSQQEHDLNLPAEGLSSALAGGIVALGKFDALHIGHRELAIQASKIGAPYLLSFVGMAEVLGWEPRAPIVAKCDRSRVLSSWAPYCGNVAPVEVQIEFSSVRHLTPRQFVEKLAKELGVCGVVAGENYRFGYKAAGDASELVRLCEEYGIGAYIINSVMDRNQDHRNLDSSDLKDRGQVSSTRVRHALAAGDTKYVSELLGRQHRLMLMMKDQKGFTTTGNRWKVSVPKVCLLNLAPKDGFYENCSVLFGNEKPVTCRVFIDTTHIHLEVDELRVCKYNTSQDIQLLGIEFGDCRQN